MGADRVATSLPGPKSRAPKLQDPQFPIVLQPQSNYLENPSLKKFPSLRYLSSTAPIPLFSLR